MDFKDRIRSFNKGKNTEEEILSANPNAKSFKDLLVFGKARFLDGAYFKELIADKISGNLEGTADMSTKAYKDILGQIISSTYIKDISMEGDIVTVVRGDGTSYSFDINDNDTTYPSASEEEEGVSKLYSSLGENEDGGVSQKVVTDTFYQINETIDNKQMKASYDEETKQISLYY